MEFPKFKQVFNQSGESLLPHRPPFLFLDRLLSTDETGALGEYTFTPEKNEFFKGHFPDFPVVPGVVLVEALCQVAGASVVARKILGEQAAFALAAVDDVRFKRPVRPGEKLTTVIKIVRERAPLGVYEGFGYAGDELADYEAALCDTWLITRDAFRGFRAEGLSKAAVIEQVDELAHRLDTLDKSDDIEIAANCELKCVDDEIVRKMIRGGLTRLRKWREAQ